MIINQIIILFILFQKSQISSFKCGNSKKKKTIIQTIDSEPFPKKFKRELSSTPINIYIDYEIIENQISNQTLLKIQEAFNLTIKTFQNILSVKTKGIYTFNKNSIDKVGADFDSDDVPFLINNSKKIGADLYLVPFLDETLDDDVQAAAYPMISEKKTMRPVLGCVDLNPSYDYNEKNSIEFLSMLLLHEISHVMAFNNQLFQYFQNIKQPTKNMIINGLNRTLLATPKVLEYARGHFGCPSLPGVELENQGGEGSAGSHWEARIMLGDYMISTDYPELVISDITLAVFEDSGWYNVNYYTGGLFKTGKGEGCNFLQNTCINKSSELTNFPLDFCDEPEEAFCTPGLLDRGECTIYLYNINLEKNYQYFGNGKIGGFEPADFCPVSLNEPDNNYKLFSRCDENGMKNLPSDLGEKFGKKSFCFLSSLINENANKKIKKNLGDKKAMCYEVQECNDDFYYYLVDIGDNIFNCTNAFENQKYVVEGYEGFINCPPYWRVCGGSVLCNNPFECSNLKSTTRIVDMKNFVKNKEEFKK